MMISQAQEEKLHFSWLFEKALQDWPSEVDLTVIEYSDRSHNRYTIAGFGSLADKIGERYIGASQEVIMVNLHDAIFNIIHDAARFCKRIRVNDIREDTVKLEFEHRLRDALKIQDLGWQASDIELIQKYFSNSTEGYILKSDTYNCSKDDL